MNIPEALLLLNLPDERRLREAINARFGKGAWGERTRDGSMTDIGANLVRELAGLPAEVMPNLCGSSASPDSTVVAVVGEPLGSYSEATRKLLGSYSEATRKLLDTMQSELAEAQSHARDALMRAYAAEQEVVRLQQMLDRHYALLGELTRHVVELQAERATVSPVGILARVWAYWQRPVRVEAEDVRQVPEFAATEVYYGSGLRRA